ncbi:MAG: hypothetical protein OZ934_14920 [Anaerolineae bacterium]|nr:hypothetical protein [Anaerolineae bacterium]
MTPTVLSIDAIVSDPAIRGGRPSVAGRTVTVADLVARYLRWGADSCCSAHVNHFRQRPPLLAERQPAIRRARPEIAHRVGSELADDQPLALLRRASEAWIYRVSARLLWKRSGSVRLLAETLFRGSLYV